MHSRPLIDFPSPRRAPREIVRRLREIDPTHELVWTEEMGWILGCVKPSEARRQKGQAILAAELAHDEVERDAGKIKLARLLLQGFGFVEQYEENEPSDYIIRDAGVREYNYRLNREAAFQRNLAAARGDARDAERTAQLIDGIEAEAGSVHKHAFARPIYSIPTAGTP